MSAVFDASVVVKWFVDDPLTPAARAARLDHGPAISPDLMLTEVANAFRRYVVRGELTMEAARDNLQTIAEVVALTPFADVVDEAFAMACPLNHSMTDCIYAVLARRLNAPLVTADAKLARKLERINGLTLRMIGA